MKRNVWNIKFRGEKHFSQVGTVQNRMEVPYEDGKSPRHETVAHPPTHPPALAPAKCILWGVKMVCYMSANMETVSNNSTEGSFILSSEINHHCHSNLSQAAKLYAYQMPTMCQAPGQEGQAALG